MHLPSTTGPCMCFSVGSWWHLRQSSSFAAGNENLCAVGSPIWMWQTEHSAAAALCRKACVTIGWWH